MQIYVDNAKKLNYNIVDEAWRSLNISSHEMRYNIPKGEIVRSEEYLIA